MLALMNVADSTELFVSSGAAVKVPQEVINQVERPHEFKAALTWAFKAGLISHADYLAGRDVLAGRAPICLEMQPQ